MPDTSRDVRIARVLIIISIVFGLFVAVTLLYLGLAGFAGRIAVPGFFPPGAIVMGGLKVIGVGVGLLALRKLREGALRRAGIYTLAASLLPPLDLLMFLAALFLLVVRRGGEPA